MSDEVSDFCNWILTLQKKTKKERKDNIDYVQTREGNHKWDVRLCKSAYLKKWRKLIKGTFSTLNED